MKKNLLKYCIAAFFLCSNFVMFAAVEPGDTDGTLEGLESEETLPINHYVWVLALVGLLFVFMKIRALQRNKIQG